MAGGISFSKEGLASAASDFGELQSKITTNINVILSSLETIDSNWSGPEHSSAASDKINAEENLRKAEETINNMNEALSKLSTNASNVSYNG